VRIRIVSFTAILLCVGSLDARAQSLSVGDPAPKITISRWVKGEKLDHFEPGKTYVIEFWSTWFGPCRSSIPHLTELKKQYKDRGTSFIGVSVWEQDQKRVEPFVQEMGDKMGYAVALDEVPAGKQGNEGAMAQNWMQAAEEHGVPTDFIVKNGRIAWIGHPMSLDEPLGKVVSGDWDIKAAASQYHEVKAQERKSAATWKKIDQAIRTGEPKDTLKAIDKALTEDAKLEEQLAPMRFQLLCDCGSYDEASTYGNKLTDSLCKDNPDALNSIAWTIVGPAGTRATTGRDLKLAMKAAQGANELTQGENWAILDTLAKVHSDTGDHAKALEFEEKAVKLANREDKGMKDRLEQYRKAAPNKH
jgi:thiol-disulfide isomerase/thioredoxin